MINVLVNGCNGRMGKEVINQISLYPNMTLSCGFDINDTGSNSFPTYQKIEDAFVDKFLEEDEKD